MKTRVKSFAKINLFLYITSRRKNGFHNLYSLMTQIDLCDDIDIDFTKKEISITCDYPGVPEDESNLACRAAKLFYDSLPRKFCREKKGLSIEIFKKIPPGRGLGGGSSNAAVVLTALNNHFKTPFSKVELMEMGLNLGADIPFFIFGSPAIARAVGEKLEKVTNLRPYHILLCDPGVLASTADVFKNIDFQLTSNHEYSINCGLDILLRAQEFDVRGHIHNDLESSAFRLYPEIRKTKEEMELLLDRKVYMSGSGSSLFSLFSARKNADRGCERLLKKWGRSSKKIFLCSFK